MTLINKLYDFGKKAIIATAVLAALPDYSDAQLLRRRAYKPAQKNYSQGTQPGPKSSMLEKKLPLNEIIDNQLLWIDVEAQTQFKQLYKEYKQVLIKKGKFDPKKEKVLIEEVGPGWADAKYCIEKARKYLLREKGPKEYLKTYIKDEKEREKIKSFNLPFKLEDTEEGKRIKEMLEKCWNINLDNPDLSDKIYFYEFMKLMKDTDLGKMPGIKLCPFSGNPLVR